MEIRDILDKIRGQRKYQNFFKPMVIIIPRCRKYKYSWWWYT